MKRIMIFCAVISLMLAGRSVSEPVRLDLPVDKAKLESGDLQTFVHSYKVDGNRLKKRVVGVLLINAAPAVVWGVLKDWDAMGAFVPNLEYYKTVHVLRPIQAGSVGESCIEGKLRSGFITIFYTLNVVFNEPGLRQEWRLVSDAEVDAYAAKGVKMAKASSGLKNIEGFEYIESYGDGSKTIYYYAPIVETSGPVPAFVERSLAKASLKGYMEGVRKKVESLKKTG
jgi:hypothetical protein